MSRRRYGGGRPPKHGARMLERLLQTNQLDRRTRTAQLLEAIRADIADDAGGWDRLTTRERILVDRIAAETLLCSAMENFALGQPSPITEGGELLGVLRKSYTAHSANLARMLAQLGLRPERTAKVPELREYIAASAQNGHQDAQGAALSDATEEQDQDD